jgi:hypothetical protein
MRNIGQQSSAGPSPVASRRGRVWRVDTEDCYCGRSEIAGYKSLTKGLGGLAGHLFLRIDMDE